MTKVVVKKLGRQKAHGMVNEPGYPKDKIFIDPRHKFPKSYLDTLVHETLHVAIPELSETKVRKVTKIIRDVLWEHGYRWVEL